MTTAMEGAELTRVGPGTVMGELMRQYWIPAAMSSELKADGPPVRLLLLGEKLIGFRDNAGRVGVMDHRCPHRCASLFLGRNEGNGLRCVYHGWKFDVEGKCVDMPSVPVHQDFKEKVRAKAYQVTERAGVVWVYMGVAAEAPPFPELETLVVPDEEVGVSFVMRSCNFMQALEGDIDTSHFGFLHAGHVEPDDVPEDHPIRHTVTIRAPEYHVSDMPWGTTYPPIAMPAPAGPTGASPISSCRSGRSSRKASSASMSTPALGCPSTTTTPCSSISGGTKAPPRWRGRARR
jgi:phthalate 4,5-dioxygenase